MQYYEHFVNEDENDQPTYGISENNIGFLYEEANSESYWLEEKHVLRAKTAPARPLTEIEEFRKGKIFEFMKQAVISSTHLVQTVNNRYDIDSAEGLNACKSFLKALEKLQECFYTKTSSRGYRNIFSEAYRILYKDETLCYLTEILDSAQEAIPYLYVNGRRFEFSHLVLEGAHKLYQSFVEIQHITRLNYIKATYENGANCVDQIKAEMKKALEVFDYTWAAYENLYVKELMSIESEARKYITDAIEIEKNITKAETKEKNRGRILLNTPEYDKQRILLINQFAQINSVANVDGKGRDDLGIEIQIAAEGILRRISPSQSRSVRKLAENIRTSFMNQRLLLRKYDNNIEVVDPQLKKNQDLCDALQVYEKNWERGKHYFLNGKLCAQLIHFSSTLECLSEKYPTFKDRIEYRDTDIFVMIPMIMILKSCEGDDKLICEFFLPEISNKGSKLGVTYLEIKEVLYESNGFFSQKENSSKNFSINKSIRIGRRITHDERHQEHSADRKIMEVKSPVYFDRAKIMASNGTTGFKTLLKSSKIVNIAKPEVKLNYMFYNLLEKLVQNIEISQKEKHAYDIDKEKIDAVIHKIKILSIELERKDPVEWNTFQDVALEAN